MSSRKITSYGFEVFQMTQPETKLAFSLTTSHLPISVLQSQPQMRPFHFCVACVR